MNAYDRAMETASMITQNNQDSAGKTWLISLSLTELVLLRDALVQLDGDDLRIRDLVERLRKLAA